MAATGPEWKMTATNPSQDELKKWAAYCSGRYSASTNTVWIDDNGQEVSMAKIFPKPDGTLGSDPTIFIPAVPTLTQLADPVLKVTSMAKFKRDGDLVGSIESHIRSASVNISQMLVRTISPEMTTMLRATINGIGIMDNLSNPLAIINYIMSMDYSQGSLLVTDPEEQYFKAKTYFDSSSVMQNTNENSSVFAVRFNAEYQKVSQLAALAGLQAQLMTPKLLTYSFLTKMSKKYDPMKLDYDKGVRAKPNTINGVVLHALFWDNLPPEASTVSAPKYTTAQKAAYAVQLANRQHANKLQKCKKANIDPADWKCRIHKCNTHIIGDAVCMKAREVYNAKKAAEKAAEKSA